MNISKIKELESELDKIKIQCQEYFHDTIASKIFIEEADSHNKLDKKYLNYIYNFEKKIIYDLQGKEISINTFLTYLQAQEVAIRNNIDEYKKLLEDLKSKKYHVD